MIKRIIKTILFLIVFWALFIELPYYAIRWIITGKEFGDPLMDKVLEW